MNKNYILLIFYIIISGLIFYISGISGIIQFIFSFIIYGLFFYLFIFFYNLLFKKKKINIFDFFRNFAYKIFIILSIFIIFITSFVIYQNKINPAYMPEFKLSNGKKTIIFQTMAHIGSDDFYEKIKENIKKYKKEGYVLYYEGVRSGKTENKQKLDELLGVEFNKNTYNILSRVYGLKQQENKEFLNLINNKDYNVDISIDEIINKYKNKFGSGSTKNNEIIKLEKILEENISNLKPRELKLLVLINRAIMNFVIKNSGIRDDFIINSEKKDIFDIILNDRNVIIADKIINSEDYKIYVIYGLMHFDGVWSLLQKNDENRKLIGAQFYQPIR